MYIKTQNIYFWKSNQNVEGAITQFSKITKTVKILLQCDLKKHNFNEMYKSEMEKIHEKNFTHVN